MFACFRMVMLADDEVMAMLVLVHLVKCSEAVD